MKPLKIIMHDSWWLEDEDYNVNLKKTIQELNIDFPLYHRNQKNSIRFNFEKLSPAETCKGAVEILAQIFRGKEFLYCCFGEIGIPFVRLKRYTTTKDYKINCIEYYSSNNTDYFNYYHNNISYVRILPDTFRFEKYAKDISFAKGGENYQFLISIKDKFAVHFYDCRGLDVVALNDNFLRDLKATFKTTEILDY